MIVAMGVLHIVLVLFGVRGWAACWPLVVALAGVLFLALDSAEWKR